MSDEKMRNIGLFFATPVLGFIVGASAPITAAVTMVFGLQAMFSSDENPSQTND
jgi:uncharacterized membrane protein